MTEEDKAHFIREWGNNPSIHMKPHDECCDVCPSNHGTDPESEDLLALPLELRKLTVFPCAWRPDKLCKGYFDKVHEEDAT